jgi:hypothetical protein
MPVIGEYKPDLNPCPFCGSKATYNSMGVEVHCDRDDEYVTISCVGCDIVMESQRYTGFYRGADEGAYIARKIRAAYALANRWNTRA